MPVRYVSAAVGQIGDTSNIDIRVLLGYNGGYRVCNLTVNRAYNLYRRGEGARIGM